MFEKYTFCQFQSRQKKVEGCHQLPTCDYVAFPYLFPVLLKIRHCSSSFMNFSNSSSSSSAFLRNADISTFMTFMYCCSASFNRR